jgi:regulation of enolase protein 1 (concanavalin A-like superfamily)
LADGAWLNAPAVSSLDPSSLTLTTHPSTDFWSSTHYGFVRDSGHLLGVSAPADFTATVHVRGNYRDKYDQAGLMVRIDAANWLKCGIEFVDGVACLSAVATTRGFSDWSVAPAPMPEWLGIRLTRSGDAVSVEFSPDGAPWRLARLAYFPPAQSCMVGPMACSPDGTGFDVEFRDFALGPALEQPH